MWYPRKDSKPVKKSENWLSKTDYGGFPNWKEDDEMAFHTEGDTTGLPLFEKKVAPIQGADEKSKLRYPPNR